MSSNVGNQRRWSATGRSESSEGRKTGQWDRSHHILIFAIRGGDGNAMGERLILAPCIFLDLLELVLFDPCATLCPSPQATQCDHPCTILQAAFNQRHLALPLPFVRHPLGLMVLAQ
eukprot:CAMPEP_0115851120 /NCGR_PEP_ID=MMETSP0287-20121206/12315_1 /TAXON_ID=412157 /ORGANISM="Chrysochromulina rotalis, Strain UIO044" /LENGTH=116 /DNA_ID=CAMNT_0003305137 /DNA_START=383 /DNA_END=734 /DNA_ORIENTATION=+